MTPGKDGQLELPGLTPPAGSDTPMVVAAKATLDELRTLGVLERRHAVLVQLVLSLASAIDAGARMGRASAVAMAAAQLRETVLTLDPPPEDGDAGAQAHARLAEFLQAVERAANDRPPLELPPAGAP